MARPEIAPDLDLYRPALQKWMPKAEIRAAGKALARFDGIVTWKTPASILRGRGAELRAVEKISG